MKRNDTKKKVRCSGLYDRFGTPIIEGSLIIWNGGTFEVSWCSGAFKIMETKSGLEGARDGWLHELVPLCVCHQTKPKIKVIVITPLKRNEEPISMNEAIFKTT